MEPHHNQTRVHRTAQRWAFHDAARTPPAADASVEHISNSELSLHEPALGSPSDQPVLCFKVVSPFVNIRARQSLTATVLGQHDEGDEFVVGRCEGNWVQPAERFAGGAQGWAMVDGAELGLGLLLRQVPSGTAHGREAKRRDGDAHRGRRADALTQRLPLLLRAPPVHAGPVLPHRTHGPVCRWCVQRPLTLVHAAPRRDAAVCSVAVAGDFVWSCECGAASDAEASSVATALHGGWLRLADPDGWVHSLCPAGFMQLRRWEGLAELDAGPEREMEALDLWTQARVAVLQTYGPAGRLSLGKMFSGWEREAADLARDAAADAGGWAKVVEARQLRQKSAFAQCLLAVCHRDVVLHAQQQAVDGSLTPGECAVPRATGEAAIGSSEVARLRAEHLIALDRVLPDEVIAACRREAEALDAAGHLEPPAMHRALGDRRDRLVGLDEGSKLLPAGSALVRAVKYLKSLAHELVEGGYHGELSVPPTVMLACYDGQGAFYKAHMDSATSDPRRLTAILYLVPDGWDGSPQRDGGNLVWWIVNEGGDGEAWGEVRGAAGGAPHKQQLEPKPGRLVIFNARTVMHEVLPTHRKRFAVTLWYFCGKRESVS